MTKDHLNVMSFDRRRVLQGIAGGFAAAGSTKLFAPAVRAANKPIKIGYVSPKSGPLAAFAEADDFVLGEFRRFIRTASRSERNLSGQVVTKDNQSIEPRRRGRQGGDLPRQCRPDRGRRYPRDQQAGGDAVRARASAVHLDRRTLADQLHRPAGQSRRSKELEAVRLHVPLFLGARGRDRRLHRHVEPGRNKSVGAVPERRRRRRVG